jgi:hypothetical protein
MSEVLDQTLPEAPNEADLVAAVLRILAASPEPLTPSKIRAHLPAAFRALSPEQLTEALRRRVDANVVYEYPPYRSQQHRYWDRPMTVHIAYLLRTNLEESPLTWSQLRRKLPDYARSRAEEVLRGQVEQGLLHQHPPAASRSGARYGAQPPDPREPLRQELSRLFDRLQRTHGFGRLRLREAALELLHEEEWESPPAAPAPEAAAEEQPPAPTGMTPAEPASVPLTPPGAQPQAAAPAHAGGPTVTPPSAHGSPPAAAPGQPAEGQP